jgi:hypothetical protein
MIFVQILLPQILAPFLVGWVAKKIAIKKFWTYMITFLLCLVYPFILLNTYHFMDGAANAGLISMPLMMIPLTLLCQYLANLIFDSSEETKIG